MKKEIEDKLKNSELHEALEQEIKYIRVLGFNEIGQKYLKKIKKEINVPIITNIEKHI